MKRIGTLLALLLIYGGIEARTFCGAGLNFRAGEQVVAADTLIATGRNLIDELLADTLSRAEALGLTETVSGNPSNVDSLAVSLGIDTPLDSIPETKEFLTLVDEYEQLQEYYTDRWRDIYLGSPEGVRSDPDYYKLTMPATYYEAAISQSSDIEDWQPTNPYEKGDTLRSLVFQPGNVEKTKRVDRHINKQLLSFYVEYPNQVKKNESDLKNLEPLRTSNQAQSIEQEEFMSLASAVTKGGVSEQEIELRKPNFWKKSGEGELQFSQTHISDNWYKGGDGTTSLYAHFVYQCNYDDQQKVQWDNKVEWKLGFVTQPADTVHTFGTNYDMLRLTSKLGIQATKNWYYTLSAEFETQFFSSYETNSDDLVSALFSPAELNIGLGMDYKYSHGDDITLSVLINPVNYTRYSVRSDRVDETDFNIDEGKKVKNQIGSRIETTLKWKIMDNLTWDANLTYTTDYGYALIDWENTFTFSFNQYFSAKFFLHPRFDDSVTRDEGESYFQLQEQISLGLTYTW